MSAVHSPALAGYVNYAVSMANIDDGRASSDIRAVARIGQILGLYGPQVLELTAADIAESTGLNRTTAYRYCASMVAAGILERGSRRGTFTLGGLMLELGVHTLGRERIVEIAGPHLRKLSAAVRMTAVLGIRGAQGPFVALVEEDTSRVVVVTVHVGTRLDATAAQTHVFLAHGDAQMEEVVAAKLTDAERARLEADVDSARRQGYAMLRRDDGTFAVAAPVFDDKGLCATVAVLGAGYPTDAHDRLEQVLATTATLSEELGGAGPRRSHADV